MENQDSNFRLVYLQITLSITTLYCWERQCAQSHGDKCQDIETENDYPKNQSVVLHPRRRGPRVTGNHKTISMLLSRSITPSLIRFTKALWSSYGLGALMEVGPGSGDRAAALVGSPVSPSLAVGDAWPLNSPSKKKKKKNEMNALLVNLWIK